MAEIENLQKELLAIQNNMNKELAEFQQQFEQENKQSEKIDIRKLAQEKKPIDFDGILGKLQNQKQNIQQLEDDLIQQQKQVELLLQDEKQNFVIQNTIQQVQDTNIAQLTVLDDLDKKIAQMLDEGEDDTAGITAQNDEQVEDKAE